MPRLVAVVAEAALPARRQVAGGAVFHPVTQTGSGDTESAGRQLPWLTGQERKILGAAARGMTTAEISKELWVSEHTVKFHLTNIYRKLGVGNRAAAVRFAIENGLADS